MAIRSIKNGRMKRVNSSIFCLFLFVFSLTAKGQNMMTEMNELQNLSWYNDIFKSLEDSVFKYQDAMKQPQIPAERRATLANYQSHLQLYRGKLRHFVVSHKTEEKGAKALLISCFREVEINADTLHAMAALLQDSGAHNLYATYLRQELAGRENNQVGKDFIDFSMKDLHGNMVNSKSYRGKYLLVDFWASWCAPCRAVMPELLQVYHHFKSGSLEVMAVSVDIGEAEWRKAVQQDGTDWVNVYDALAWGSPVVRNYAVHRIPQNILIGPEGKIVAKNISATGLQKILSKAETTATN